MTLLLALLEGDGVPTALIGPDADNTCTLTDRPPPCGRRLLGADITPEAVGLVAGEGVDVRAVVCEMKSSGMTGGGGTVVV